MKKFLQAIVSLTLTLICLIAFIQKADWDKLGPAGQKMLLQSLSQIYFEKHPGREKAQITGSETKNGMVVIIIDEPKREV